VDGLDLSLSLEERREILARCALPDDLLKLLDERGSGSHTVRLTPKQIETLRTAVADRLQTAGFDEKWEVNAEGRLLEGIIDKLIPRTGR